MFNYIFYGFEKTSFYELKVVKPERIDIYDGETVRTNFIACKVGKILFDNLGFVQISHYDQLLGRTLRID